nr:copper resistance CopC family protein [Kribbella sandramycini]
MLALVISTGPAAAHAKLDSISPADGASMAAPPEKVVLTFNEPVGSSGLQIQVKSPAGVNVATGEPQVLDGTVTQPVGAMIETGRYQVDARVVSADGHPITVSTGFTVTHAGHPPDSPPGTQPVQPSNNNTVTIVAMCLVMLVVVALAVVIVRRRPARP